MRVNTRIISTRLRKTLASADRFEVRDTSITIELTGVLYRKNFLPKIEEFKTMLGSWNYTVDPVDADNFRITVHA